MWRSPSSSGSTRSASVTMPTQRPSSSTTGRPGSSCWRSVRTTSSTGVSGRTVTGSGSMMSRTASAIRSPRYRRLDPLRPEQVRTGPRHFGRSQRVGGIPVQRGAPELLVLELPEVRDSLCEWEPAPYAAHVRGHDDDDAAVRRSYQLLDLDSPFLPSRVDVLEVPANTREPAVGARLELCQQGEELDLGVAELEGRPDVALGDRVRKRADDADAFIPHPVKRVSLLPEVLGSRRWCVARATAFVHGRPVLAHEAGDISAGLEGELEHAEDIGTEDLADGKLRPGVGVEAAAAGAHHELRDAGCVREPLRVHGLEALVVVRVSG